MVTDTSTTWKIVFRGMSGAGSRRARWRPMAPDPWSRLQRLRNGVAVYLGAGGNHAVMEVTRPGACLGDDGANTLKVLGKQMNAAGWIDVHSVEMEILDNQISLATSAPLATNLMGFGVLFFQLTHWCRRQYRRRLCNCQWPAYLRP